MTAGEPSHPLSDLEAPSVPESRSDPGPLSTLDFLADALAAADVDGFVHAGTAADADLRYLTGVADASDRLAFGYTDGAPRLVLPAGIATPSGFPGHVEHVRDDTVPASRIATILAGHSDGGVLITPRQLPHDAARYLQNAGFELTSTTAVADARAVKSEAEIEATARAADAAMAGLERARELLANAAIGEDGLEREGEPLTATALRQAVDAAIALAGGLPAGNTSVAGGSRSNLAEEAQPNRASTEMSVGTALPANEPIRITVAPRDPTGYHAQLARTLTVDGSGGWERRAHVACEAARRAGFTAASAGDPAVSVAEELLAELGAYGFDPEREAGDAGGGIGLSRVELPSLTGPADLQPGMVLSVTPLLSAADGADVALADTVVVEDEEVRVLTDCSTRMAP